MLLFGHLGFQLWEKETYVSSIEHSVWIFCIRQGKKKNVQCLSSSPDLYVDPPLCWNPLRLFPSFCLLHRRCCPLRTIINHIYVWFCRFCHSILSHLLFPAEVNVINARVKLFICVEPKQGEWLLEHLFPWWCSVKFIWKSMSKVSY